MTPASPHQADGNLLLSSQIEERLIAQEYRIWKKNTPFLYNFVVTHGLEWPSLTCQRLPTRRTLAENGGRSGGGNNVAEQHELLIGTHTCADGGDNGGMGGEEDDGVGGGGREMNYLMVATVNLPRDDPVVAVATDKSTTTTTTTTTTTNIELGAHRASKKIEAADMDEAVAIGGDGIDPSPKSIIIDVPEPATNYNEEKEELGGHTHIAPSSSSAGGSSNNAAATAAATSRVGKIEIKMKIPHEGVVNRAWYMPQNHFIVSSHGPGPDVYI
jgi:histone-binding protein RBBP4